MLERAYLSTALISLSFCQFYVNASTMNHL